MSFIALLLSDALVKDLKCNNKHVYVAEHKDMVKDNV